MKSRRPANIRTHPSIRVLKLTTFGLDNCLYESPQAGASGFMLTDAKGEDRLPPTQR